MPEGDTIHRAARRLNVALAGKRMETAEAPHPRSPLHLRASELQDRTLDQAEARGKHLLAHFSGDLVLHSHLGMNGRWRIAGDGRLPFGKPWLLLASGRAIASQSSGKLLRLTTESRVRNDPALAQLGPDPLRPGFDVEAAASRLRERGAGLEVGEALLDQRIVAGVGNAIRNEACYLARVSPWRPVGALSDGETLRLIDETERIMRTSLARGRRPRSIYRAASRRCPECGGSVSSRGQGDANRTAYWCPRCQE